MQEAGARLARLSAEGEVVQAGDAEHGVVDAVAFEAAVAEDLPARHAGEGVLHAGANSLVGAVVFLLPGRELFAVGAAVRELMIRSAADLETPNSGASWRIVKFARQ